jgi:hypothetical protein
VSNIQLELSHGQQSYINFIYIFNVNFWAHLSVCVRFRCKKNVNLRYLVIKENIRFENEVKETNEGVRE